MASDFPFASRLTPGAGAPELTFTCVDKPLQTSRREPEAPLYTSPHRSGDGESILSLYRLEGCELMRFNGVADFHLWSDRIVSVLSDTACRHLIEIRLLGTVLSYWLELRGLPALHAASAVVEGRAVVFLSTNSGGKSSLTAALMQAGHPMLTDDLLPVEASREGFLGRPGYPQMRLWPEEAEHFLGHYEDLEIVHPLYEKRRVPVGPVGFGTFCDEASPICCIYLPERRDQGGIEIAPVSRREGVIELVRHSFAAPLVEAAGLQPRRLDLFAAMVREIPVRRLLYPGGLERLPQVRDALLKDLRGL